MADHLDNGTKRRRTPLACKPCRERKRKCDGRKPTCQECSRHTGRFCVWDEDRVNRGWTDGYVHGLQARIRELEQTLQAGSPFNNSGPIKQPDDRAPSDVEENGKANEGDAHASESMLDGMGVLGATATPQQTSYMPSPAYYGPSSTAALLDNARRMVNRGNRPVADDEEARRHGRDPVGVGKCKTTMCEFTYPSRADADKLLSAYWVSSHTFYPFIHQMSFEERYAGIWSTETTSLVNDTNIYAVLSDVDFYCLANTIFAIGALYSADIALAQREQIGSMFFNRVRRYLDLSTFGRGSIPIVQTLLLAGQYLQTTDQSGWCWIMIGAAIRIAQSIGAHREPQCCKDDRCASKSHTQLEVEMRRRTWSGCVLFDRILSLLYGRPLMIHPASGQAITLPLAIDDEYISKVPGDIGQQPAEVTSVNECYLQALRLQDILSQILIVLNSELFDGDPRSTNQQSKDQRTLTGATQDISSLQVYIQSVVGIDASLNAWRERLPVHLAVDPPAGSGISCSTLYQPRIALFRRQAIVLESRYLHLRMTMLRPALSMMCDSMRLHSEKTEAVSASNMQSHMLRSSADCCVWTAQRQTTLVINSSYVSDVVMPASWYNVWYMHSCAMVFVLGSLCGPGVITSFDRQGLLDGFNKCLQFLDGIALYDRSAQRCCKVLRAVQEEVFSRNSPSQTDERGTIKDSEPRNEDRQHRQEVFLGETSAGTQVDQQDFDMYWAMPWNEAPFDQADSSWTWALDAGWLSDFSTFEPPAI